MIALTLPSSKLSRELEVFASLHAHGELAPPPDDLSVQPLVRWLRRNKYPLLALSHRAPSWLREDPDFLDALCEERAWYDTQRGEFELARLAWLERGVSCLMIKSAGSYPSFPHTSDNIDVLFRPEEAYVAREVLRQMGYVEVRNVEEPGKYLFRRFHDGRCVSAIHVHERIAWFVGFLDDALVWERMRPATDDPGVNVPSPEDAILINLAHACYENKELRLVDVMRVRHALESTPQIDWDYMLAVAGRRGWEEGLAFMLLVSSWVEHAMFGHSLVPPGQLERLELVARARPLVWRRLEAMRSSASVDLPLDLSYPFCKVLYYGKIMSDLERSPREKVGDTLLTLLWGLKLKSGIRPQAGMVVSFSGIDGSGKTAHARALAEAFSLCELQARYFWCRGGSTGLLALASRARALLRGNRRASNPDAVLRRRRELSHPLLRWGWTWGVALDQVLSYLVGVHLRARTGKIVVCDRYIYDAAVEVLASLPKEDRVTRAAIAFMLRVVPRPDLGYLLDLEPSDARARKPEEPWHSELDAERRLYLELADRFGLRVVPGRGDFADLNDPIIREAFQIYMGRFETWLNALFVSNPSQRNVPDPVWRRRNVR